MPDMNRMIAQLFNDQPISGPILQDFQTSVMARILAQPMDFENERSMMKRRQWGILLAVSLIFSTLALGTLLWFYGDIILQFIVSASHGIWGFLPGSWQAGAVRIGERLADLRLILGSVHLLWQYVSVPLVGLMCLFVLSRGHWEGKNKSA